MKQAIISYPQGCFLSPDSYSRPARNDIFMICLRAKPIHIHSPFGSQRVGLGQRIIDTATQGFAVSLSKRLRRIPSAVDISFT